MTVKTYAQQKVEQLCNKLGIPELTLKVKSWDIGCTQNDHFQFEPIHWSYDDFREIADKLSMIKESYILEMWADYLGDIEYEFEINPRNSYPRYADRQDVDYYGIDPDNFICSGEADAILDDAKHSIIGAINAVIDGVLPELDALEDEIFKNLQDYYFYGSYSFDDDPVREITTKNFKVEVFELPKDSFEIDPYGDNENLIDWIEMFKDGEYVGYDLCARVTDYRTDEVIGAQYLGDCYRSKDTKEGFCENVRYAVSEAIMAARQHLEQTNQPIKQIA